MHPLAGLAEDGGELGEVRVGGWVGWRSGWVRWVRVGWRSGWVGGWVGGWGRTTYLGEGGGLQAFAPLDLVQDGVEGGDGGEEGGLGFVHLGIGVGGRGLGLLWCQWVGGWVGGLGWVREGWWVGSVGWVREGGW